MLLHAIERGLETINVFADTGNEHKLTLEYLDYLRHATGREIITVRADFSQRMLTKARTVDTKWRSEGVPDAVCDRAIEILQNPTGIPYLDLCILKGRFPASQSQFCTAELKVEPIAKQVIWPTLDTGTSVISWQGVRKQESKRRAGYTETELYDKHKNGATITLYRPLLEWTADDVFALHRKHGIEPNPLYLLGMNRVGCMPCINCRKDELLEISKRFPDHIDKIREWEAIVSEASKRGISTFFPTSNGTGNGIDEVVQWANTSRGGVQFNWLRGVSDTGCMSSYGLCE